MPTAQHGPIAGFILAGGVSRRMGQDKALMLFQGRPLIQSIAEVVETIAGSAIIVGDPDRYRHLGRVVIPDRRKESGPLAGIEAGLMHSETDRNLFVACDMPELSADLLQKLMIARRADCVIPRTPDDRLHPLCAIWDRNLLQNVRDCLDSGRNRVLAALQNVDIEEVHWDTVPNTNTPEEWIVAVRKNDESSHS